MSIALRVICALLDDVASINLTLLHSPCHSKLTSHREANRARNLLAHVHNGTPVADLQAGYRTLGCHYSMQLPYPVDATQALRVTQPHVAEEMLDVE